MTVPLAPEVAEEMKRRAQGVKERMAAGSFTKQWNLSGKNAIVEPGRDVLVRLCPRWDFASSMILQGDKRVANPDYKGGRIYVIAYEHWWDAADGKTQREWCPRTLWDCACPGCKAADEQLRSPSKDERAYGKRIQAKEVFIFNAAVGKPRRLTEKGQADIRILCAPGTIFSKVSDIMTGGAEASFGRGDISHPREGYDLKLTRPVAQGDRWAVDCAPGASPLYEAPEASAFKGWPSLLVDLEQMLLDEVKPPVEFFKAFYGRDPEAADNLDSGAGEPSATEEPGAADDAGESAVSPEGPDDEFMPPPANAPAAKPTGPAPKSVPAAVRPPVPSRPTARSAAPARGRR